MKKRKLKKVIKNKLRTRSIIVYLRNSFSAVSIAPWDILRFTRQGVKVTILLPGKDAIEFIPYKEIGDIINN